MVLPSRGDDAGFIPGTVALSSRRDDAIQVAGADRFAMAGKRSPGFLVVLMVAAAVVWGGLLFWAATSATALAWIAFVVGNIVLAGLAFALWARRREASVPGGAAPKPPADDVYRPLVIVNSGGGVAALSAQLLRSADGRRAEALVVAPAIASKLDWLTGDQTAYDRASAELDATVAALRAAGIDARARMGASDPVQAAADGLREFSAEAIVVVTNANSESWLEEGMIETLQERTAIPVTQVVVE